MSERKFRSTSVIAVRNPCISDRRLRFICASATSSVTPKPRIAISSGLTASITIHSSIRRFNHAPLAPSLNTRVVLLQPKSTRRRVRFRRLSSRKSARPDGKICSANSISFPIRAHLKLLPAKPPGHPARRRSLLPSPTIPTLPEATRPAAAPFSLPQPSPPSPKLPGPATAPPRSPRPAIPPPHPPIDNLPPLPDNAACVKGFGGGFVANFFPIRSCNGRDSVT